MKRANFFGSIHISLAALALAALAGCSGGAPTTANPDTTTATKGPNYVGKPPENSYVQAFKLNVWDNLETDDRCGACHKPTQTPRFVRDDDINAAYAEALTVVDLVNPSQSRMVAKVRGGHHCWLTDNNACGDTLQRWIEAWANTTSSTAKQVTLIAPTIKDAGASKSFPTDPTAFATLVWPILKTNCSRCHTADSATQQQPYFATKPASTSLTDIASALATAYSAAQTKMNLDDPSQSRFVLRLRNEFHNCWAPNGGAVDCAASADVMEAAIANLANGVNPTAIDPSLVISKALAMYDGTVASGGSRFDSNVIALYEFKTGKGATVFDTSGVAPAMDLGLFTTPKGGYAWVGGWGLQLTGGKAQALTTTSNKLTNLIGATGEYSIEAWVAPGNVAQTEARIVSYSGGLTTRNFELGQTAYNYDFFNRTSKSNANGTPALSTPDTAKALQATLQHVVVTYDPVNGRRIYINGVFTGVADNSSTSIAGLWDDTFALVLGNEVSGDKPWLGQLKMVAIHNRALTLEQIQQNFAAGVGERYFVLFSVSHLINVPQSYIVFEVSQYDSYAYLFKDPKFVSLDPTAKPGDLVLKGMRIGINGVEAAVGQAYSNLDTVITDAAYSATDGESLSNVGTVIGLQKGPDQDQFFLTFDQLGTNTHVHTEPAAPAKGTPVDPPATSDVGVRTFDAINTTMSKITGVSVSNTNIVTAYASVKQSMPVNSDFAGFLDSHQSAIAQLATAYCAEVVKSSSLSTSFFGTSSFDFSTQGSIDQITNSVVSKVLNTNLTTQPSATAMSLELSKLINNDPAQAGTDPLHNDAGRALGLCRSASCSGGRTTSVATAVCAAGIAGGAMLIE